VPGTGRGAPATDVGVCLDREPSCLEEHFRGYFGQGTIFVGYGKVHEVGAVENGVQPRNAIDELLLEQAWLARSDALLHGCEAGGKTTDLDAGGCDGLAAEFEGGTVFHRTGHQKSVDAEGGIVRAHELEVRVHHAVSGLPRREMGEAEGVEIDGGVWDVTLSKKIGRFAENG